MYFDEKNVMYTSPENITCANAYECKYTGKRPPHCEVPDGHSKCGTTINGNIPEGDVPDGLLKRLRQVIPFCHARQ